MEIQTGDQLFINNKWYVDVITNEDDFGKFRFRYYEGIDDTSMKLYKTVRLPISIFTITDKNDYVKYGKVSEIELKKHIGGLILRLVKEKDIFKMFEDAGMGGVSFGTMSGTPGVASTPHSGDIAGGATLASTKGGIFPNNEFGLEIHPKSNKKIRKRLKTKAGKTIIKKPVIFLDESIDDTSKSDNNYKLKLFDFLDYPSDDNNDIRILKLMNELRPNFLEISADRIKNYIKDLYELNKNYIINNCSDWLNNNIVVLGDIKIENI